MAVNTYSMKKDWNKKIGKYPISVNVSGYVEPSDIELI